MIRYVEAIGSSGWSIQELLDRKRSERFQTLINLSERAISFIKVPFCIGHVGLMLNGKKFARQNWYSKDAL